MADHPEGQQSITVDRTSALVASGLVVLAILGVVSIFSDAIAAVWSPRATVPAGTTTAAAPAAPTGAGGSS